MNTFANFGYFCEIPHRHLRAWPQRITSARDCFLLLETFIFNWCPHCLYWLAQYSKCCRKWYQSGTFLEVCANVAVGNLSRTLFFHRQTDISGQNPCVFTCILKDGQFYDVFLMVFARYGLLGSIQGFPQPSKVRQGSLKLPLGPCGLKVEAPEAQSLWWKNNSRIWTKTNCQPRFGMSWSAIAFLMLPCVRA